MVYCGRDYHREWFRAHPGYFREKKNQYIARNREFVKDTAHKKGCCVCGVKDDDLFYILEGFGIANSVLRRRCCATPSIATIKEDLDDMTVRCRPCAERVLPLGQQVGF